MQDSDKLIKYQEALVITSALIAAILLLPAIYTIYKAVKAQLTPIVFISSLMLLGTLSWVSIQVCFFLELKNDSYHTKNDTSDWLLPVSITIAYICFNSSQLLFALKYWGLSIKLD